MLMDQLTTQQDDLCWRFKWMVMLFCLPSDLLILVIGILLPEGTKMSALYSTKVHLSCTFGTKLLSDSQLTTKGPTPTEDYYHRATISDHGNFQQWVHNKQDGRGWAVVWEALTEPCTVNNICGVLGFCTSVDNKDVTC